MRLTKSHKDELEDDVARDKRVGARIEYLCRDKPIRKINSSADIEALLTTPIGDENRHSEKKS